MRARLGLASTADWRTPVVAKELIARPRVAYLELIEVGNFNG